MLLLPLRRAAPPTAPLGISVSAPKGARVAKGTPQGMEAGNRVAATRGRCRSRSRSGAGRRPSQLDAEEIENALQILLRIKVDGHFAALAPYLKLDFAAEMHGEAILEFAPERFAG